MSFQEVGTGFVQHYYNFFSTQRAQLAGIYRPSTLLTWQSEQMQGVDAIMARFANLGFSEAAFKQDNVDCQPSLSGGVLVVVNGEVALKDERHPLKFNDVFHLASDNGQWYVSNQVFNIVGGGGN
ncbi:putative nuclear transport factor 2 [Leptomonas pyrrhocoris]|uniref:Nuclear transport factor 2 n=1 Tax=Leptomonas pyrrhocoris TaxID=157538 RepID=A0A0M9FU65_LEPPY|nr:putative nuclear transport factor 2 [Leptomonas pyrrhocoris]XP_015654458.1 putative nuclear transport factor 2 [Leptomonas pyrrhocoris]XP_015654459.1 putative nuclear transport factor 2 [Leptomonas pyrrhocoris]KPA76018.1 putative nuclear transport factor 2 [Leptomonas pyrrhocoris]KPA76019.1 putative nuclear transport factor 2 [Leptomonas pyrrhocoris]KPA76020.1 putative nuclear transport factor 2 [Leptomonas pyrrhocoris]|eukprot:XP_015654457.1 putative nuclear transport factor 2 [Leptomonas pyrrhocoris]